MGAQDFEAETKSRSEELKALAEAKKILKETTGGAEAQAYGLNQESFFQITSKVGLAQFEAVRLVRDLARRENSRSLTQLASRLDMTVRRPQMLMQLRRHSVTKNWPRHVQRRQTRQLRLKICQLKLIRCRLALTS